MSDQEKESTPLERYLAKQRGQQPPAPSARAERASPVAQAEEPRAREGLPAEPGGFGARTVAFVLDVCIVTAITTVIASSLSMLMSFMPSMFHRLFTEVVRLAVIFLYYGWFYSERGATPGKMLLQLRVVELGTGRNLTYGRAFLRETLGKLLSFVILGFGFFMCLLRADRMALHDLLFDTRVVQKH